MKYKMYKFFNFEPIVLSLYPDKKINSKKLTFETEKLILLMDIIDGNMQIDKIQ